MKIAFDAQLLFEKQKTGIDLTVGYILKILEIVVKPRGKL